jgi:hypothetical protein
MEIKNSRGTMIGVAALCLLLSLSCFESGGPSEPPHPEVPPKPAISAVDISTTGVYILRWSRVAGAASFVLEEDLSTEFALPYTAYSGPDTTMRIVGKTEGYVYYYRVRGYNDNGSGPWSDLHAVRIIRGVFPQIVVSSDTMDFGMVQVGQGQLKQLQVSNSGSAALTVTRAAIDNPRYTLETVLPIIIRPGTSANLDIRFVPNAAGIVTGTLTVFSNDEDDYPPAIRLTGEGI